MPTGYTADVGDGKVTDFHEFVWQCARAFGALILMRDDPRDAPIPKAFEPSPHYAERATEARKRHGELMAMTTEQIAAAAAAAYEAAKALRATYLAEKAEIKRRYEAMLAKARDWRPPTSEHVGLRDFMVEQLTGSIDFDCTVRGEPPSEAEYEPVVWHRRTLDQARKDIVYYATEQAKEAERAAGRNRWIADLRASVPIPERVSE